MSYRKRIKLSSLEPPFEKLPDDLVITILSKLCSSSSSPPDFINALLVCKRFYKLGMSQMVLTKASPGVFALRAKNWCEYAHRFLKFCVNAGSIEACYFLGMIRFYCLENRGSGASLMAKAAIRSHAPALYSLAVIQFNGSGGSKSDKDLRAGVALCARAASLGHVDAFRELGHCVQDGYGIKQNVAEGRKLLVQANARELIALLPKTATLSKKHHLPGLIGPGILSLLSDYGPNVAGSRPSQHPVNRFLVEWFGVEGGDGDNTTKSSKLGPDMMLCSHSGCGRPETRAHEFRRCSVCGKVNYCSRGCQAMDWKLRHKVDCFPANVGQWVNVGLPGVHGGMVGGVVEEQQQEGS